MTNKLKNYRLSKNYTQEFIAQELGITQKAYSKIENGQVCLSNDKRMKLSEIYNLPPHYFCDISCECLNSSIFQKMKEFLSDKDIELPDFLT